MYHTQGFDRNLSIHGLTISYDDVGEGGIPIIFLHGYPFNKSSWRSQLTALKASNRAIAVDIRGFGGSKDETTTLGIDLFADDLIRLMDELSIESAVVCGLSMGGYIALNVQKRYPDRFAAMILCDTQCAADSEEGKRKRYQTIETIKNGGEAEFKEGFIQKVFCEHSLSHQPEIVEALRAIVLSTSQHSLTAGLVALAERTESCSTLSKISIPTLILCGKEDALTPVALSELMHEKIQGSVLHILEDAGHVSNIEQPDAFNRYLMAFVAGLRA